MKKEYILGFALIIIIIIIGFLYCSQFLGEKNDDVVVVGHTKFIIPEGYKIGNDNQNGAKNISNGKYSIFLFEYNNSDIDYYINGYNDYFNQSVTIENYTVNGTNVYKLIPPNTSKTNHFYFVKNDRVYDIYIWDGNPDINALVGRIINYS